MLDRIKTRIRVRGHVRAEDRLFRTRTQRDFDNMATELTKLVPKSSVFGRHAFGGSSVVEVESSSDDDKEKVENYMERMAKLKNLEFEISQHPDYDEILEFSIRTKKKPKFL